MCYNCKLHLQFCLVIKQHVGSQKLKIPENSNAKMSVRSCHLGKYLLEIVFWENVFRKLSFGSMSCGNCHWGKCRCNTVILVNTCGKLSFDIEPASTFYESIKISLGRYPGSITELKLRYKVYVVEDIYFSRCF